MKIFCLSDPHLAFSVNKPMDIYGDQWKDHPEKIKKNWEAKVTDEDLVIVPGDISWASNAEQVKADMDFFESLPGHILFGKGNHENWWNGYSKASQIISNNATLLDASNPYITDSFSIVGTRMWDNTKLSFIDWIQLNEGSSIDDLAPRDNTEANRIFERELTRLDRCLEQLGDAKNRIVALHYPPTTPDMVKTVVTKKLSDAGVQHCVFGHIHSMKPDTVFNGLVDGVHYHCCSCDYIDFDPVLITEF